MEDEVAAAGFEPQIICAYKKKYFALEDQAEAERD
jgi:hypothetical protein